MLFVANYSMKGLMQAMTATALLSLLTVWFAPFGILLGAVIALVTLRVGVNDGLKVLAVAMAVSMGFTLMMTGSALPAAIAAVEYMMPIWLMAMVLRNTNSLAASLNLAMVLVGFAVISFHFAVGDTVAWWKALLEGYFLPLLQQAKFEDPIGLITTMTEVATMLLAMSAVVLWFSILLLARWWQSELYYPGRFKDDFYQIRLPKNIAYLAVIIALAGLFIQTGLIQDISGVMMAGLMFVGLSIVHHAVSVKQLSGLWLGALYVTLFVFPHAILILATIGLIDSWADIRSRWSQD